MPVLASAQLSGAITANQTVFGIGTITTPTGSVGFPAVGVYANPQQPVQIDSEIMYLVIQNPSGVLQVRTRGAEGTLAVPHDTLANVYTGTPTDFGAAAIATSGFFDANLPQVLSIGTTLTYTVAIQAGDTTFNINTTPTPAAITLPAPLLSMNGTIYTFLSNTAIAHVITATNLILSGSGAQPKSTATFPAVAGAGATFVAENGFWLASGSVTIA